MQGDRQVIAALQAQLKNELTAINQYYMHYRLLQHWGFAALAQVEYKASIHAMRQADVLMDRILILDGLPNLQDLGKLQIGEDTAEALACDLRHEQAAQSTLKSGIATAEAASDYVSRDVLKKLLERTEERLDFLQTQLDLIDSTGLANYLQSQMGEANAH